jgi:hypothetical protein
MRAMNGNTKTKIGLGLLRRPRLSHGIRTVAALAVVLGAAVAVAACKKTPEPEPRNEERGRQAADSPPSGREGAAPSGGKAAAPADLAWDVPGSWEAVNNPSMMRKATYRIPKTAGGDADAEMSVSQAGGEIDANVNRWVSQFEGGEKTLKRETRTINGLAVTIVEVRGTYASGMPGGPTTPKSDHALLGAIVSTDPLYFFKLVGPEKTVFGARSDFDKLVASFRAK